MSKNTELNTPVDVFFNGKCPEGVHTGSLKAGELSQITTQRQITSLSIALTKMSNSFEKLGNISSSPKLPNRLPEGRRHSIHVPCPSSLQNAPGDFKNLFKINPLFTSYPPGKGRTFEMPYSCIVETKKAYLPSLNGAKKTGINVTASQERERDSWSRVRSFSEESNPLSLDPKSAALPEIRRKPQVHLSRRYSLPVTTETDPSEDVSVLRRGNIKANTRTPQITQPENHNLQQKNKDRESVNLTKLCPQGTKTPDKKDRAEALRKHVKKAETGYRDGTEVKAARMFEWLKEQTDKDEAN